MCTASIAYKLKICNIPLESALGKRGMCSFMILRFNLRRIYQKQINVMHITARPPTHTHSN